MMATKQLPLFQSAKASQITNPPAPKDRAWLKSFLVVEQCPPMPPHRIQR